MSNTGALLGGLFQGIGRGVTDYGLAMREEALVKWREEQRRAERAEDRAFTKSENEKERASVLSRLDMTQGFTASENEKDRAATRRAIIDDRIYREDLAMQEEERKARKQKIEDERSRNDPLRQSQIRENNARAASLERKDSGKPSDIDLLNQADKMLSDRIKASPQSFMEEGSRDAALKKILSGLITVRDKGLDGLLNAENSQPDALFLDKARRAKERGIPLDQIQQTFTSRGFIVPDEFKG